MRAFRIPEKLAIVCLAVLFTFVAVGTSWSGNKRMMTIMAAKAVAERAVTESVYGLKLRSTEEVYDMVASSYLGTTESKTSALMSGVRFENIVYDPEKDIAQATALVTVGELTNIDGVTVNFNNRVFKRTGFATSTKDNAGALRALRAAELDAYKQLIKAVVGFKLESNTSVENFLLKSDEVKVKVMATLYTADVTDYGWTEDGDAFVKMQLNVKEFAELIGDQVTSSDVEVYEVEGMGAQQADFQTSTQ
jgi:hypothetical protein